MPASSSDYDAAVREGLRDAANLFVREVKAKISSEEKLSSKISEEIVIEGPFQYSVDIVFNAPMALAYEYGSGEHATRGKVGRYRIPREGGGDFVAFPLERWPGYEPPPDKQSFVFPFVMHPGVRPVPYVAPTIEKTKAEIARMAGFALITTYIGDEKVVEIYA